MRSNLCRVLFLGALSFVSCSKTKEIATVNGVIDGKPAITLYGSSLEPTDYLFIDTLPADRKISYNGILFTYTYSVSDNIYIINSTGTPAADGTLSLSGANVTLTIDAAYSIVFGSPKYTSR